MMKLILRIDDLGLSEAVNYGVAKIMHQGLAKDVGLMVNMDASEHGYELVKGSDVNIGIHMNISVGRPVAELTDIPSLVNQEGLFNKSTVYRTSQCDIVSLQEAIIECEAQYQKYIQITGHKPGYIDIHAIPSKNFNKAAKALADKYDIPFSGFPDSKDIVNINGNKVLTSVATKSQESYSKDLENILAKKHDGISALVFHPGYVDYYLLNQSSLNIERVYDLELLLSAEFKNLIRDSAVKIISYKDLKSIIYNQ